jgi:hypothetical protein
MKYLKHASEIFAKRHLKKTLETIAKHTQYPDEPLATYV